MLFDVWAYHSNRGGAAVYRPGFFIERKEYQMKVVQRRHQILACPTYEEALRLCEVAGRTCYKSEGSIGDGTAEPFIRKIIQRQHLTILEHLSMTARLILSRGESHEIVRHRIGIVFSQESTRYCNYGGQELLCIQPSWMNDASLRHTFMTLNSIRNGEYDCNIEQGSEHYKTFQWIRAMEDAEKHYNQLIESGLAPQFARGVLPHDLKVDMVVTANLREWRHVFNTRVLGTTGAPHSDIKALLTPLLVEMKERLPVFFEDMVLPEENQ